MIKSKINNLLENIIEDDNDLTRRCFRAWIDGGYNGESSYRKNFERVEKANTLSKLRSFTVEQFTCRMSSFRNRLSQEVDILLSGRHIT